MSMISNKRGVQQLVIEFKKAGIQYIVFSPGSRNAPLVVSFSQDDFFNCFVIPDERSAAFYALGMADVLMKPVAVICTSGSAVVNYYPAVTEAFYRSVPLIVLSADRPADLIDQGHGQSIRQEGIFHQHILEEVSLIEMPEGEELKSNLERISRAIQSSKLKNGGGPVHINFPFSEPLYDMISIEEVEDLPLTIEIEDAPEEVDVDYSDFAKRWNSFERKMIICGQMSYDAPLNNLLNELSRDSGTIVLVENTSNLSGPNFVSCIDRTLNSISSDQKEWYTPDLLISIGGAVISKRIKAFLKQQPKEHWKIGVPFPKMNTYDCPTTALEVGPKLFFRKLKMETLQFNQSRFGEQWKQLDYLVQDKHSEHLPEMRYSDMKVFEWIMDVIPENAVLHMSNSSVVRYCQLFDPIASLRYFANRGTSGIDGSTSTAMGSAIAEPDKLHVFVSGDMSFFYDSNALWNNHLPVNFRMIVINNSGGGIFKIIPGPATTPALEEFFVTNQSHSAKHICKAFQVEYLEARSLDDLEKVLPTFFDISESNGTQILEVCTPMDESTKVLQQYFESIRVEAKQLNKH